MLVSQKVRESFPLPFADGSESEADVSHGVARGNRRGAIA
jgi:hypothetical protein